MAGRDLRAQRRITAQHRLHWRCCFRAHLQGIRFVYVGAQPRPFFSFLSFLGYLPVWLANTNAVRGSISQLQLAARWWCTTLKEIV